MRIEVDTHTHTTASCHAYSTLKENADAARRLGLRGIALTDHTPAVPGGSAPLFIISSVMRFLPEYDEGVRIIKGMETNIIDSEGNFDADNEKYIKYIEWGIASMHNGVSPFGAQAENTAAYINVLRNPYINALGHIGDQRFPIYKEDVVKEAGRLNKIIEINNHSFESRAGSARNCAEIARLCKKHDVKIAVSSDAHSCYNVGRFDSALAMLKEIDFPEELVINSSLEKFLDYINQAKQARGQNG